MTGKVKWFNNSKGYGFISANNDLEVFVHYADILEDGFKTLSEGQEVSFDLYEDKKGYHAKNLVKCP